MNQFTITTNTSGRGLIEITHLLNQELSQLNIETGLLKQAYSIYSSNTPVHH